MGDLTPHPPCKRSCSVYEICRANIRILRVKSIESKKKKKRTGDEIRVHIWVSYKPHEPVTASILCVVRRCVYGIHVRVYESRLYEWSVCFSSVDYARAVLLTCNVYTLSPRRPGRQNVLRKCHWHAIKSVYQKGEGRKNKQTNTIGHPTLFGFEFTFQSVWAYCTNMGCFVGRARPIRARTCTQPRNAVENNNVAYTHYIFSRVYFVIRIIS
jgi:hypothetical protein